jgi:hypothetical protein
MSAIIKLLSKFDDSGIRKAKSGFSGLSKTLGAIGIGFGIKQLTDGLLDAAKAASADAKSTNLLNVQLVKNAGATDAAVIANGKFIETLSLQTGIMDDDLRPAMGKLVRATGDVETAQDLLTLSLDAATVAGRPLETVAQAMARAFTGNKTALIKLFPSLKTSTDLFGDLEKIVGGAAIAQADPFMLLNNSMDILKEKLGVIVLPLITDFIEEISPYSINIDINGAAEISCRTIDIMGLKSALIRPKLSIKFHNELIPDYHYASLKCNDLGHWKDVADAYVERFEELKKDPDQVEFLATNGRRWYEENGTISAHVGLLNKLIDLNKLK